MPFGVWNRMGPEKSWLDGVQVPYVKGNFEGGNVICMANGWLKEQDQQFFYNGIRALEKRRTKCISVAGNYLENWHNTYLVINCESMNFLNAPRICAVHHSNQSTNFLNAPNICAVYYVHVIWIEICGDCGVYQMVQCRTTAKPSCRWKSSRRSPDFSVSLQLFCLFFSLSASSPKLVSLWLTVFFSVVASCQPYHIL